MQPAQLLLQRSTLTRFRAPSRTTPVPNPMAPASAAVAGSSCSGVLAKFQLHSASLLAPTSPLVVAATGSSISLSTLQSLRSTLVAERQLSIDRITTRDSNRRLLSDRAAREKKAAEDMSAQKEADRVKRKEDAARQDRERIERQERERIDGERKREEERAAEFERKKKDEEDEKRRVDDEERELAVKRARELKELRELKDAKERKDAKDAKDVKDRQQAKAEEVFALVRKNEHQRKLDAVAAKKVPNSTPLPPAPLALPLSPSPTQQELQEDVTMLDGIPAVAAVEALLPVELPPAVPPVLVEAAATSPGPREPTPTPTPARSDELLITETNMLAPPAIKIIDSSEGDEDTDEPLALPRHKRCVPSSQFR